ncbi:MAG: alpha/beta hydrolase fold domain-containing protein [Phormidesmis sp.]
MVNLKAMVGWMLWIVTLTAFALSVWIVLPAPNLFFLRLAVAAPEVSPLLLVVCVLTLVLVLYLGIWGVHLWPHWRWLNASSYSYRGLLVLLSLALTLCALPWLQQPRAIAQAEQSMAIAFPNEQPIPSDAPQTAQSPRFSYRTFFRGFRSDPTASDIRHTSQIPFASPAGNPLFLDLYQPPLDSVSGSPSGPRSAARVKYPTVVTIYGGSWQRGDATDNAAMARFLACRGYVVVAIDYRHAPAFQFPAQLNDVQTALAFVQSHADDYEIDSDRMALLGWSAGAHLAMLAAFQAPSEFSAVVSYYGPINLTNGYKEPPVPDPIKVQPILRDFIGGTPAEKPDVYIQASPISYVKAEPLPPTLLLYGDHDHVVEARFGHRLYERLIAAGHKAVWVKLPQAEHAFDAVFSGLNNQMSLHFIERFLYQTLQTNL